MWLGFVLLAVSVAPGFGQVPGLGRCKDIPTQTNFNITQYLGQWYEIMRFYTSFEYDQKCNYANYYNLYNGNIGMFNYGIDIGTSHEINATGEAYIPDPNDKAKLKVKFSQGAPLSDYWVLDTDYKTYTVIFSCIDIAGAGHLDFSWILARETSLDPGLLGNLLKKIDGLGLKSSNYRPDLQAGCYSSDQHQSAL